MDFFWQGLRQGWDLVAGGDPYTVHLIWVTLRVAVESTLAATAVGLPLGLLLGLGLRPGRSRRRTGRSAQLLAVTIGNTGLALPPVLVGLVLSLLMFPAAPLGRFHLLFTLRGVIVAQTVLGLPVVVALTATALRALPPGLLAQARGLGATTLQVMVLALREARLGVATAVVAAFGSALSEVGAVVLVGGNIQGRDQTLASAALQQVDAGHFGEGMAIGIVLFGLIVLLAAVLTLLQVGRSPRRGPDDGALAPPA